MEGETHAEYVHSMEKAADALESARLGNGDRWEDSNDPNVWNYGPADQSGEPVIRVIWTDPPLNPPTPADFLALAAFADRRVSGLAHR